MKQCEYCSVDHDGSYGSGRFCSLSCRQSFISKTSRTLEVIEKIKKKLTKKSVEFKSICECCQKEFSFQRKEGSSFVKKFCGTFCARSFSTKTKRKEINEKIRETLKNKDSWRNKPRLPILEKECSQCKESFNTKKENRKFCCKKCSHLFSKTNANSKEKIRTARLKEIEKGNVGYGLKTEYNGIRCDSALEYTFLKWYLQQYPEVKIERFKGFLEGEGIKYQPDFIIDNKIIVEVKYTAPYIGEKLSKKWKTYLSTQEAKKKLLSKYEHLWITEKDVGSKLYRQCIREIKTQKAV